MGVATLIKSPGELLSRPLTFSGVSTIQELIGAEQIKRNLVAGSEELVVTPSVLANAVTLLIGGGTDGEQYIIRLIVRNAAGEEVQEELEVAVLEAEWVMPDGGAPYLSVARFVERFGLAETIRMTDGNGSGRIDRAYLVSALTDAQAQADAELSGRYAVPLAAPVPPIVETIVADLARARLYPAGAPDGVSDLAKAAQRSLERLGSGAANLPSVAIEPPAVSATPIYVAGGERAYPDGLKGFR